MSWATFADWQWHDPQLLWSAALLPLALLWRWRRRPAARPFAAYRFLAALPRSSRQAWVFLPLLLQALALLFLVVAMARPQALRPVAQAEEGLDLLLCLDHSSSMAATDLDPQQPQQSRMAIARAAAQRFIAGRPQDRIGLLVFARDSQLRCPPTLDHASLAALLEEVEAVPAGREDDATAIGLAVARAALALGEKAEAPMADGVNTPAQPVILLLTDGEESVADEHGGITPEQALRLCRERGIRVHAIAAGPDALRGRASLWQAVAATGGQAFAATDAAALDEVYRAIDQLETSRFERLPWRLEDRFLPFLLVAVLLQLLAWGSEARWWRIQA